MLAEQALKIAHRLSWIVPAKPPEPIGSLAYAQLQVGAHARGGIEPSRSDRAIVCAFRLDEDIPASVLVVVADPRRKCAVHPAAGDDSLEARQRWIFANNVAERRQPQLWIFGDPVVQRAQE